MVSARAPRVFNLYDVLGVFFPGTALLVGLIVLIPDTPTLESVIPYLGFIILSFSFGHILQYFSSHYTGDLKIFDETIRNVQSPISSSDEEESDDEEPDQDDDGSESDESEESESGERDDDKSKKSNPLWIYVVYPFIAPIVGFRCSPNCGGIDDLRNPNTVWTHLSRNYRFDPESSRYEEMLQVISSRIDDPASPNHSYRFQAIRNFHRGMWLTAWALFMLLVVTTIYTTFCNSAGSHLLADSYILSKMPISIAIVASFLTVLLFWLLTVHYERDFIRFLITDYVVIVNQDE